MTETAVMKIFSIVWRILANVLAGIVILAMFRVSQSPFETIVVSALVLIYVSVIGSYMKLGYALSKKWQLDSARFIEIGKSLRLNTEPVEEALKEDREEGQKGQAGFWISAAFNMLFGLIAFGNLIYAIASQFI